MQTDISSADGAGFLAAAKQPAMDLASTERVECKTATPKRAYSLVMKLMNSDTHSWTVSLASFAILALGGSAFFIIRLMLAIGRNRSCSLTARSSPSSRPSSAPLILVRSPWSPQVLRKTLSPPGNTPVLNLGCTPEAEGRTTSSAPRNTLAAYQLDREMGTVGKKTPSFKDRLCVNGTKRCCSLSQTSGG
jgi:hypothetical protein